MNDKEKTIKAREILNTIIGGHEPYTDEEISEDSFLNDPRMLRCLSYIINILTEKIERPNRSSNRIKFYITDEEIKKIMIPEEEIGINKFCNAVNESIELGDRKKLTGAFLNKKLKEIGVLAEEMSEIGKKRTVLTEKALEYGIKTRINSFDGREYEQIVYGNKAKEFLLDNLQEILAYNSEE